MSKVDLRLDWCSYEAAKFAVEHWHYSRSMPVSKSVKIGVWENNLFIGAVIYSWGANPNLSKMFNLEMVECAELVRVALTSHKTQVSRIISISSKMIKKQSNGLRLLVSFADQREGHHGGIYQGAGWIYSGETNKKFDFELDGRILQRRSYTGSNFGGTRLRVPDGAVKVESSPKYKYLFPLDDAMRKQIEPLRKPYPKRDTGETDNAAGSNQQTEGASPIVSLLDVQQVNE
jgi:hypothetical protein